MTKWLQRTKDGSLPSPSLIKGLVKIADSFGPVKSLVVSPLALLLDEVKCDLFGIDLALQKDIANLLRKWGKMSRPEELSLHPRTASIVSGGSEILTFSVIPTTKIEPERFPSLTQAAQSSARFNVSITSC